MERQKFHGALRVAFAGSLVLAACVPKSPEPILPTFLPQYLPTTTAEPLTMARGINIIKPTSTPTPTPTPEAITDPLTGAIYTRVDNPVGGAGRCVRVDVYKAPNTSDTTGSKQTVVGAATVLGPDSGKYNDYPRFIVILPNGQWLGSFTTDVSPLRNPFRIVPPGTKVCED